MDQGAVIDQIFIALRWNGFYQTTRSIILLLGLVNLAVQAILVVFVGKSVAHQCRTLQSSNITVDDVIYNVYPQSADVVFNVSYGACQIDVKNGSDVIATTSCRDGYEYDDSSISSFVSQWNLVCEKESFSDVSQSVFVGGEIFASLFLTPFADQYGRKICYVITNVMLLLVTVASAFSPTFIVFLFFRFASGAFIATTYQMAYTLMMEMMPTSHRALPEKIMSFLWSLSLLFLCLVAYLTRHLSWHYTQLILGLFNVYALLLWWLTDESLRWLCAMKRHEEAEKAIRKIARINRVDPQKALDLLGTKQVFYTSQAIEDTDNTYTNKTPTAQENNYSNLDMKLSHFIKKRYLLKMTLIAGYLWFVDALVYDGLLLISPNLHDDFYLGFVLGSVIELPASVIFSLLIDRIGRKKCTGILHPVAGIALLSSMTLLHTSLSDYIPGHSWLSISLSLLGRLAICAGYSTTLVYVPELFPTSVRNTAIGIVSAILYSASAIAPYTRTLSRHIPWVPSLVFGVMCLSVPLAIIPLPETKGRELAQTVDGMDKGNKDLKTSEQKF